MLGDDLQSQIKASGRDQQSSYDEAGRYSQPGVQCSPLPIQRRIAGILSAYDELIENSQRRIKILESMARALYREWFVHFRFPGFESVPRVASPRRDPAGVGGEEAQGRLPPYDAGPTPKSEFL